MEIVIEQRRWMDIVIEQWCALEDAKQKKARAGCRNHSSTTTASQPKKADIIQCALSIFAGGPSGTRWRGECLMKCSSQDVKASCSVWIAILYGRFVRLQSCPVAVVGWWWMVVLSPSIYILSFPTNFVEGPLHGACLWVTPQWMATSWFVSVCLARCASFRCVL